MYRRETIILKGEAQTKAGKVENTKGHLRKKIEEARKKLKQTTDSIAFCGREAKALQASQGDLSRQLEERQQTCHQLQATAEALEEEAAQLSDTKQLVCTLVRGSVCRSGVGVPWSLVSKLALEETASVVRVIDMTVCACTSILCKQRVVALIWGCCDTILLRGMCAVGRRRQASGSGRFLCTTALA